MAIYKDGEKISGFKAGDMLQKAFQVSEFPNVSDILGADWSAGQDFNGDALAYRKAAFARAAEIYGPVPQA